MHHVLGSDIDFCQITSLQSHGQAALPQSGCFRLRWMTPVDTALLSAKNATATCICHQRGSRKLRTLQISTTFCTVPLWGGGTMVHSDGTARESPCGADFYSTWQNFICMLDNANLLKFYVIRNSLQTENRFGDYSVHFLLRKFFLLMTHSIPWLIRGECNNG